MKMFPKKSAALLLALAMVFSLAGCDDGPGTGRLPSPSDAPTAAPTATPEPTMSPEELEAADIDKYNSYINVNNFMVDRLELVINSYFDRVVFQEEFALVNTDYWCNSLGSSYMDDLDEAHEYALLDPKFEGLDATFEAMYPTLKEMMGAFDEVYEYSDLESFLDDDYAKAKELHAVIWRTYNEYVDLSDAFMAELDVMAEVRREESLQTYLDNDMPVHYSLLTMLMSAQDFQQNIFDQEGTDETLTELDLEQLQPLYDDFVAKVTDCMSYISDDDAIEKEGWYSGAFTMLEMNLKDAKVGATRLMQRIKDQEALQSYETSMASFHEGTISYFNEKLGSLIDSYNNLW